MDVLTYADTEDLLNTAPATLPLSDNFSQDLYESVISPPPQDRDQGQTDGMLSQHVSSDGTSPSTGKKRFRSTLHTNHPSTILVQVSSRKSVFPFSQSCPPPCMSSRSFSLESWPDVASTCINCRINLRVMNPEDGKCNACRNFTKPYALY